MEVQPQPPAPPCWSSILMQKPEQKQTPPPPQLHNHAAVANNQQLVGSCKSSKGIAVAIVDANAIINGGESLAHSADRFVSVDEVISEIRDPASRHSLNFLPFSVDTMEPSPDALKKVINFAKATGDLHTLSDVDMKLIALTYTFEAQIHGTQHLRDSPPPIQTVNVKRLPEKDLPGWGSNVPNLEEWEALEQAFSNASNTSSRILPIKDLSLGLNSEDQISREDCLSRDGSEPQIENTENDGFTKPKKYLPKKTEVKIEGKKMVAAGINASQGQLDDNADDWLPAVSRSTHRRFLRRKARREMNKELSENTVENETLENPDDSQCPELLIDESYEKGTSANFTDVANREDIGIIDEEMRNLEITSQSNETVDTSNMDDLSSEQSWTLRSLSESSVACITSDFAMQNVLLQMGLRLLAPGGIQIHELHRWVLKCHACYNVTTEVGRIFCPKCGNGGTLRKIDVTVTENGVVLAGRKPRISLRGTKFSLPLPQGGRDAITKNPVLREDQLPSKFLYPKTKKKNKQEDDFFVADDVFRHQSDKKSHLQPAVRKALAVFSGKRNPNDNHYARAKC